MKYITALVHKTYLGLVSGKYLLPDSNYVTKYDKWNNVLDIFCCAWPQNKYDCTNFIGRHSRMSPFSLNIRCNHG
jgi:hypothetical protein